MGLCWLLLGWGSSGLISSLPWPVASPCLSHGCHSATTVPRRGVPCCERKDSAVRVAFPELREHFQGAARLLVLPVCFAKSRGAPGSRCRVLQEAAVMPLWMAGAGFDLALWPLSLAYPGSCSISSIASSCLCQRRRGGSCRARSCCLAANK